MGLKYREQENALPDNAAHRPLDNVYIVGCSGFIYTAASIVSEETRPPSAALIVSAGAAPFRITVKGKAVDPGGGDTAFPGAWPGRPRGAAGVFPHHAGVAALRRLQGVGAGRRGIA